MDYSLQLPSSMVSNSPMINYRKDARKAIKFTFMVAGELGTGKSTFINCLLNRKVMGHTYEGINKALDTKTLAFTLATSVALPNTAILARNEFDASAAHEEPGIALTETKVESIDEDNVRLQLNIIDTPGFGDNLNNELCLNEIENYLKQQFDLVLAEETRIRRNPRFVDTRVHVLLYFITPTGHGLRELDITCMKRLSKYVNIIPVIGRADSFTESEIQYFKQQIRTDIERFNVPVFQFDNYMNDYDEEEDYDLIQECKYLTSLQPFAVVASEQDFEIRDNTTGQTKTIKARQYPWGLVDVNNPKYSDFSVLKSVLLGSHLQDLRDLTHDFLYETYRTERLTKVTGSGNDQEDTFHDTTDHDILNATVPSMSNLAQLTEGEPDTTTKFYDKEDSDENTSLASNLSRKPKTMLLDDDSLEGSPKLRDSSSFTSSVSTFSDNRSASARSDNSFKRHSIGPQRNQLRQISETVPYVIRHERILERQHKLEEMEVASAKELSSRAAMLEKKAAELKAKEKMLLQRLEEYKKKQAEKVAAEETIDESVEPTGNQTENGDLDSEHAVESSGNYSRIQKEETLTDLHSIVKDE
ncbi:CIC11C00000000829 [Sungouiella intermedia]|uniref:CIC11C00000000829 n=1 Tax=Sungouiella intermedia TaxID=45354 RepID=A0A1L0BA87_9ASCO|nr:CIC11C00000000829 [[Candida] intermedia]